MLFLAPLFIGSQLMVPKNGVFTSIPTDGVTLDVASEKGAVALV